MNLVMDVLVIVVGVMGGFSSAAVTLDTKVAPYLRLLCMIGLMSCTVAVFIATTKIAYMN